LAEVIEEVQIASNCTLKDGAAHVELKEVFALLADGVAKEAEMETAGETKEGIEKEWLPRVAEVGRWLSVTSATL